MRALVGISADSGCDFALLRGVFETNEQRYICIANKAVEESGVSVAGKVLASGGLTFKAKRCFSGLSCNKNPHYCA